MKPTAMRFGYKNSYNLSDKEISNPFFSSRRNLKKETGVNTHYSLLGIGGISLLLSGK